MGYYIFPVLLVLFVWWLLKSGKKRSLPAQVFDPSYRDILQHNVLFYQRLDKDQQQQFEERMATFLRRVHITGIGTGITDEDRVFVAASAIIPIFAFPGWEYRNINEVLIYPDAFNEHFEQEGGNDRDILGIVGEGALQNQMILSRHALQQGFLNKTDKNNTAIHEFIHLIDKADGATDGVPEVFMREAQSLPWLKMMHKAISDIKERDSDINPYGATNEAEFLAVAAEYFFERPELLQQKHPQLYALLEQIFDPGAVIQNRK